MTQYLLSVHLADGPPPASMTDEQIEQGYAQVALLEFEMKAAGALRFTGRLAEPESATVVRVENGETTMTDGPYIESKELIAGSISSKPMTLIRLSLGPRRRVRQSTCRLKFVRSGRPERGEGGSEGR